MTYYLSYRSRLISICQGRLASRDVAVCIVTFSIVCEALLARFLIIGQQPNIQLVSVFQYELSPVPHVLVGEFRYLLFKGDKSVTLLMKKFGK